MIYKNRINQYASRILITTTHAFCTYSYTTSKILIQIPKFNSCFQASHFII